MDQIGAVLKRAMPFQTVPPEMLQEIVKLAKLQSHARGDMIYDFDEPADDIYIVASGSVNHSLRGENDGEILDKVMRTGDVFGWAAVLTGRSGRMARTTCLERTEVLRINGEALMALVKQSPASGDVVMSRFATMITKEFSAPPSVAARVPH